jgi:hypothetical protein
MKEDRIMKAIHYHFSNLYKIVDSLEHWEFPILLVYYDNTALYMTTKEMWESYISNNPKITWKSGTIYTGLDLSNFPHIY